MCSWMQNEAGNGKKNSRYEKDSMEALQINVLYRNEQYSKRD